MRPPFFSPRPFRCSTFPLSPPHPSLLHSLARDADDAASEISRIVSRAALPASARAAFLLDAARDPVLLGAAPGLALHLAGVALKVSVEG